MPHSMQVFLECDARKTHDNVNAYSSRRCAGNGGTDINAALPFLSKYRPLLRAYLPL